MKTEGPTVLQRLPAAVRNKALAAGSGRWLEQLDAVVAELEQRWSIEVGAIFADATEALVAEVKTAHGAVAVLKVLVPHNGRVLDEITALELMEGRACVELLRSDRQLGAMLLERLGRPLVELGIPLPRRLEILASLAARVWRPAGDHGLATGADKARRLMTRTESLWTELDRPCTEAAVAQALAAAERRAAAHRQELAVLVHGDVHQWNALQRTATPKSVGETVGGSGSGPAGFTLVDPDGLVAEPACDLGVLMREDPVELVTGDPMNRARTLAALTGCDVTAIWDWGLAERVATGLTATRIGLQPVGRQMLAAADRIACARLGRPRARRAPLR